MTVDWGNGLQFDELLEIAKALNVNSLIDPGLRNDLLQGSDALLMVLNALKQIPFVLQFLPGDLGGKLDGAIHTAELMKALLEA